MLGKTFYVLLTGREPAHLLRDDVPPPLFHVIDRSCSLSKGSRYQTLAELKQALDRAGGVLLELFSAIRDRLATSNRYNTEEVSRFIGQLAIADEDEQRQIFSELPEGFYSVICQAPLLGGLTTFLSTLEAYVEGKNYSFAHAETIANRMNQIFDSTKIIVRGLQIAWRRVPWRLTSQSEPLIT